MAGHVERMPSGIRGLDHLLEGGLVRGNSILIEGPPGSGKSTFGIRILYEGIIQYDEPGLIITFEEFPRQIYEEALGYGVDLRSLEAANKLRIVWTPPSRILEGFTGKNDLVDTLVKEMGVRRLVIDSITHFKRVADSEIDLREVLGQILNYLKIKGVNAILIKELERMDDETIAFEEYLVDASLRLHNMPSRTGGQNQRFLEIRKTRGQGHVSGRHPFRLGASGLDVFPHLRLEDIRACLPSVISRPVTRKSFGVAGLDTMLSGGFWSGSLNLIIGYSGTGKSVLCYHFLDEGLRASEDCMLLSFKRPPEHLLAQARTLGMNWDEHFKSSRLRIPHFHPTDLCMEEMFATLLKQFQAKAPSRFVMDSIDSLFPAVKDAGRLQDYIQVLAALLDRAGATSILIGHTHEMGGTSTEESHDYYSQSACVIQLSMAESNGELRRFVGVQKHAGSDHAKELREFQIDSGGFHVERKAAGLSGILTGQTQGALVKIADEVLPALDEVSSSLRALADDALLSEESRTRLSAALSNLGLTDILLREHFGITEFHKLAEELPAADAADR